MGRTKEVGVRECPKKGYGVAFSEAIKKKKEVFKRKICFFVNNGRRIKFSLYKWCGDTSVKEFFPTLFAIAISKDSWVANLWKKDGNLGHWCPSFSKQLHDWELEMMEAFLQKVQKHSIRPNLEDRMTWSSSRNEKFFVKTFYSFSGPRGFGGLPS